MKREELLKEIDWLETLIFLLSMKDKWTADDFTYHKKWTEEIEKLKKSLTNNKKCGKI